MEPEFVNESMWDDDDDGTNNDETNFGEDDSNMEMTGFDGSATGDGNLTGSGEGGAVGDAQVKRRRKRISWVEKYCRKIADGKYQCKACSSVLKMPNGLFSNMKRHIKSKHQSIYLKELKPIEDEDEENKSVKEFTISYADDIGILNLDEDQSDSEHSDESMNAFYEEYSSNVTALPESDPDLEEKIKILCEKSVVGKRKNKTFLWNFFKVRVENRLYRCIFCGRDMLIVPYRISNLKRHLMKKHVKYYELILKYAPNNSKNPLPTDTLDSEDIPSIETICYDIQENGEYKCKNCDEILQCPDGEGTVLFDHIKEKHSDLLYEYQEDCKSPHDYSIVCLKNKDSETE